MPEQIDRKVAAWLALVAEAVDNLPKCTAEYGEFYVSRATISFDGDETGYAIVPDEFGGYAISIDERSV